MCDRGLFSEDAVICFAELFTEGVAAAGVTSVFRGDMHEWLVVELSPDLAASVKD